MKEFHSALPYIVTFVCCFTVAQDNDVFAAVPNPASIETPKIVVPDTKVSQEPLSEYQTLKQLESSGKRQEAITQAINYLKSKPQDTDVHLLLGIFYYRNKDYLNSEVQLNIALTQVPTYLDVRLALINTEIALGKNQQALQIINKGLELSPKNTQLLNKKLFLEKKMHSGLAEVNSEIAKKPVVSQVSYDSVKAEVKQGNLTTAKRQAEAHLSKYPRDGDMRLLLGTIYSKEKNYVAARKQYHLVLRDYPKYVDARLALINLEIADKQYSAALKMVKEGLVLSPNNTDLLNKKRAIYSLAEDIKKKSIPEISYDTVSAQIKQGNLDTAKRQAETYLTKYPNDGDMRLLLGNIYSKEKNYAAAEEQYHLVLRDNPNYTDARLALINAEIADKQYSAALKTVKEGLALSPNNATLLYKQSSIYYLTKNYYEAGNSIQQLLALVPQHASALQFLNGLNQVHPRYAIGPNEMGVYQTWLHASDVREQWNFTTLFYGRDTGHGMIYARLNYASRLGRQSTQGELEAFPQLGKYLFFDIDMSYANNPNLFPDYVLGNEIYVALPNLFDLSMGVKYNRINAPLSYTKYTGSIGKYFLQHNWISFRPNHFVPNNGDTSTLYTVNYKYYFDTIDTFIGLMLGSGKSPDLFDLTSVDFITTRNNIVTLTGGFPLANHRFEVNLDAGYQHQVFPNGRVRDLTGGSIGVMARF